MAREINNSSLVMLQLLDEIADRQPVSLGELAVTCGRPKTTVHRALSTLHHAGWIRPSGDERTRWVLTSKVIRLARRVADHHGLRDAAAPVLERLRDDTYESILLAVTEDRDWAVVEFFEGSRSIRLTSDGIVGRRFPLHAGASGKAILATWNSRELERYIEAGLVPLSGGTIVDPGELRAELGRIRRNGYCMSRGETVDDPEIGGMAAPISDGDGVADASIAIGLPGHRLESARARKLLAEQVRAAAQEISARLAP
jgi:IclR family acetate operon transcriptional repressor